MFCVEQGDCIELLAEISDGSVDLVFADPPFNIGVDYGKGAKADRLSKDDYLAWSETWIQECVRVLAPDGSFWLAIPDEYVAELKVRIPLTLRNWVIWYYTFGVYCVKKFGRSHTHLLYFVKNPKRFTFLADDIRVPSARQIKYNDWRADSKGRVPSDVWEFSRVCGTFKERVGWHPCQMPEALLARIIQACTYPGDLVVDPFAGSGTTLVVASRLGRRAIGFEINPEYVRGIYGRV